MLMCEKTAQQNLCAKGGVPEAQPILGYDIWKKGKYEPLQNVDRNLCKQWCVFFECYVGKVSQLARSCSFGVNPPECQLSWWTNIAYSCICT